MNRTLLRPGERPLGGVPTPAGQPRAGQPRAGQPHAGPFTAGQPHRRGAVVILTAILLVFLFGMLAFSIDLGYMQITESELQSAADGAALAAVDELGTSDQQVEDAARSVVEANRAANEPLVLDDETGTIEQGWFDENTREFDADSSDINAVKVRLAKRDIPLMFAPVLGTDAFEVHAESIAMVNPRDIVLVVDLSGSMNNDTETAWATELIDARYAGTADAGIGTRMAQDLYDDLGFGLFPGPHEHIGQGAYEYAFDRMNNDNQRDQFEEDYDPIPDTYYCTGRLTGNQSPLAHARVGSRYRINRGANENQRRHRAYNWVMDHQIKRLMPAARPVPNSQRSWSRKYWYEYLDYVGYQLTYNRNGTNGQYAFSRKAGDMDEFQFPLEYNDNKWRKLHYLGNPSSSSFPGAGINVMLEDISAVGYRSYVNFLNDYGWNATPGDNATNLENPGRSGKGQLSKLSPNCPWHDEDVDGELFSFPPRTQPMHACRRSMIRALQTVRGRNERLADSAADRVAIVTYDADHRFSRPSIVHDLDSDYDEAMLACTELQACYDGRASTATENALVLARNLLKTPSEHRDGQGRAHANKLIVLLTDGKPNLYETDNATIDQWIGNNPSPDYYANNYAGNAPLMQAAQAERDGTLLFGLSMGMGSDADFMGRLARLANTDEGGNPLNTAGDPSQYERVLTSILEDIVNNAGIRLVK